MILKDLLPYRHLDKIAQMTQAQAQVSIDDKRTIRAALGGDDAILSLVIQTAFHRTAKFIRDNGLNIYDTASFDRILTFIRDGADTCAVGHSPLVHVPRELANSEPTLAPTPCFAASLVKSDKGGERTDGKAKGRGKK